MFDETNTLPGLSHAAPSIPTSRESEIPRTTFGGRLEALKTEHANRLRREKYGNAFNNQKIELQTKDGIISDWYLKHQSAKRPTWSMPIGPQKQILVDEACQGAVDSMPLACVASLDDLLRKVDLRWKPTSEHTLDQPDPRSQSRASNRFERG